MPAPRGGAQPKNKQIGFDLGRVSEESALYFQEGYLWALQRLPSWRRLQPLLASLRLQQPKPPGSMFLWLNFHIHQLLWSFPLSSAALPCFSYPKISISLPGLVAPGLSPICHKSL